MTDYTNYRCIGPIGLDACMEKIDEGTMILACTPLPGPILKATLQTVRPWFWHDDNTRMLAATVYAEASIMEIFKEMSAIASVLVRQQQARGYQSISAFIKADKTFAYAAHDGNQRYKKLINASEDEIDNNHGMKDALQAASNVLHSCTTDYSNGAYFWDGADIKSNYDNHAKVKLGIHFTDVTHNIYGIKDKNVPGEEWWRNAKHEQTTLRGKWNYVYESTAAYGGTVFWKYNTDFLRATGNKEYL